MDSSLRKNINRSLVLVVSLMVIAISVSYAFYRVNVEKVNEDDTSSFVSGDLKIKFLTSKVIDTSKSGLMYPIKDAEVATKAKKAEFVVSHDTGSLVNAVYYVSLVNVNVSDNYKVSPDVKWQLVRNGAVVATGDFRNIDEDNKLLLTTTPLGLDLGDVDNLELRIWISDTNVDQSSLFNGSISAKVQVSARY